MYLPRRGSHLTIMDAGDDRRVARQVEVDAPVGHQVGLELRDIRVQGSIEVGRGVKEKMIWAKMRFKSV